MIFVTNIIYVISVDNFKNKKYLMIHYNEKALYFIQYSAFVISPDNL